VREDVASAPMATVLVSCPHLVLNDGRVLPLNTSTSVPTHPPPSRFVCCHRPHNPLFTIYPSLILHFAAPPLGRNFPSLPSPSRFSNPPLIFLRPHPPSLSTNNHLRPPLICILQPTPILPRLGLAYSHLDSTPARPPCSTDTRTHALASPKQVPIPFIHNNLRCIRRLGSPRRLTEPPFRPGVFHSSLSAGHTASCVAHRRRRCCWLLQDKLLLDRDVRGTHPALNSSRAYPAAGLIA
jgi:hypothetical protein